MAHPSPNRTAAIDELTKGHELVSQLGAILPADTGRALLDKISDTFSRALVALKSGGREGKSENFDAKKRTIESAQKGRPRKRTRSGSTTKITTNILDDGHSWRKYGQKNILDLKFPRCYFRCSNKFDQNCPAMRQVQQSEEDPSLYVITYIGEHTCQSRRSSTASLAASVEKEPYAACIINFGSTNLSKDQDEPKFPPPSLLATATTVGPCEEGISSTLTHGSSMPAGLRSSALGAGSTHLAGSGRPEHGDVTSCLQEDDSVWDLELDYFSFTDVLGFD